MDPFRHVGEVLRYMQQNYANPKALNYYQNNTWHHISTESFILQVKHLAMGLISLGLKKGEKVGLLAESSPHWTIADTAIMIAGGVSVPLFGNISDEHFNFEAKLTGLRTIIVAGDKQWELLNRNRELFDSVINLEQISHDNATFQYEGVLRLGEVLDREQPDLFDKLIDNIHPEDEAAIIFTSGSTGVPKGAVHTHGNLVGIAHADAFSWDAVHDRYLSLLPLAHIFARSLNLIMLTWGISIYYWNDLKALKEVCQEIQPTTMIVVPRILEKLYTNVLARIKEASFFKKIIGLWGFHLANQEDDSLFKKLCHPIADKMVYSAFRNILGGKMRVIISGGAHLNTHLNHFFLNVGFPLYEGWGLTEGSTITVNQPVKRKVGTIGLPLGDLKVKISDEGEILVHGPTVMKGYYSNPEATARAIDADGWLYTGDKGEIDKEGFVTITGRIKEFYKMSNGEFVTPIPIEMALCKSHLIDRAVVIAEDRDYVTCLLFPDFDQLRHLKALENKSDLSDEEFLNSNFIKHEIEDLIINLNKHVDNWEEIQKYHVIMDHPTIEGGELTPTMKIKREVIEEKYHHLIDEMYLEEAA